MTTKEINKILENTHDFHIGRQQGLTRKEPEYSSEIQNRSAFQLGFIRGQEEAALIKTDSSTPDDLINEIIDTVMHALHDVHIYYPHDNNYRNILRCAESLKRRL